MPNLWKKMSGGKSRKGGKHRRRGGTATTGNCQAAYARAHAGLGQDRYYPGDYKQQQAEFYSGKTGGKKRRSRKGGRRVTRRRGGALHHVKRRRGGTHKRGGNVLTATNLTPLALLLGQKKLQKRKKHN